MLDLSDEALTAWAASDERVPEQTVEGVRPNEGVSAALERLTTLLNRRGRQGPDGLVASLRDGATLADLRVALSDAGAWHALRVITWLIDELPGGAPTATDLIDRGSNNSVGGILAEAERSLLLGRLYAQDRLSELEEACRNAAARSRAA